MPVKPFLVSFGFSLPKEYQLHWLSGYRLSNSAVYSLMTTNTLPFTCSLNIVSDSRSLLKFDNSVVNIV